MPDPTPPTADPDHWLIYRGDGRRHGWREPATPPWRRFDGEPLPSPDGADSDVDTGRRLGGLPQEFSAGREEVELVNAALYLRRPLLVTGRPGTGKSTLAYSIAHELGLGPVLRWPITSRATLTDGLYRYDAIGRLQDANLPGAAEHPTDLGRYLRLGPLGSALVPHQRPRVLLIDEIDKSDIDLPNDLLNVFEEGEFEIPELARLADRTPRVDVLSADGSTRVPVHDGRVRCHAFPVIIMTSNEEREFPPAFLRRCVRLRLTLDAERLRAIVAAHLGPDAYADATDLVDRFWEKHTDGTLAADQLLNAIYLTFHAARERGPDRDKLADVILTHLGQAGE